MNEPTLEKETPRVVDHKDLDDLERARRKKELEQIEARLDESFATMRAITRNQARLIMWSGAFQETDLHQMLRGQILVTADDERWPCEQEGADFEFEQPPDILDEAADLEEFLSVRERDVDQRDLGAPLEPVTPARNHLQCPLVERARAGDTTVPCERAQRMLPKGTQAPAPATPSERLTQMAVKQIIKSRLTPCGVFHQLARDSAEELLGRTPPPRPLEGTPEGQTLEQRRVRKHLRVFREHDARVAYDNDERARAGLSFLRETKRLERWELAFLIDAGVYVTDPGWLPCRDDKQRTFHYTREEQYQDDAHFTHERWMMTPQTRQICQVQAQARMGDRRAPCCEALKEKKDPVLIARDERGKELERKKGLRVSVEQEAEFARRRPPPPKYWLGSEDEPGAAEDPVIVNRMRPCLLIGQVLARSLYPLAQELAAVPAEEIPALIEAEGGEGGDEDDDDDDLDDEDDDDIGALEDDDDN